MLWTAAIHRRIRAPIDPPAAAPLLLVGDVHPLLALARGDGERAVHVDHGLLEERGGLLLPDVEPRLVDRVEQAADMLLAAEAAAEIARGGGVGNGLRTDGVEERFVVAPQFDVLQTGSFAQRVDGEVEDVVRLVIRQVDVEQTDVPVDGLDQSGAMGDPEHQRNAAVSDAAAAVGQRVLESASVHDGPEEAGSLRVVFPPPRQPLLDRTLASLQSLPHPPLHSKSLRVAGLVCEFPTHQTPQNAERFRVSLSIDQTAA